MSRHSIKILTILVLSPLIIIGGYLYLSQYNKLKLLKSYYEDASIVMSALAESRSDIDALVRKDKVDEWNRETQSKLEMFFGKYSNEQSQVIKDSMEYTRALFGGVYKLRLEYANVIEVVYSERMQDQFTVRDDEAYAWRTQTLDDTYRYLIGYSDNLNQTVDNFRQAVVSSHWGESYRTYAWQEWGRDVKSKLSKLLPNSEEAKEKIIEYRRFFDYMHKNREEYYINDKGEFVFSHERYVGEFLRNAQPLGDNWTRYSVVKLGKR